VSLHATKILGAGEGGFIVTSNSELRDRMRAVCNFGFLQSRTAAIPAINAKMSEYHAAVALAALARWPATCVRHKRIMAWYQHSICRCDNVSLQPGFGEGWITAITNVLLPPGSATRVAERLLESGIDTRQWWGAGCHAQEAFKNCPCGPLPVTNDLGSRVLGLPHFPDMRRHDVARVFDALSSAISSDSLASLAERLPAS